MLSEKVADIIIPLHVITGSDHTSGFYGHGKKKVLEKVKIHSEARELLGVIRASEWIGRHFSSPSFMVRVQM